MLKQTYVRLAQAAPSLIPNGLASYLGVSTGPAHGWRKWISSLGAIYHLDRMVALDIPWWNVAATRDIEAWLQARPKARVFEYGSGASTVWLGRRAHWVTSVEHDAGWAGRLREKIGDLRNVTVLDAGLDPNQGPDQQAYVRSIEGSGPYDMIVIDGRLRATCLRAALPNLATDGIVVFDDSGRSRYRAAIDSCGLREAHYFGLSYCVPYPDHTSVLTRAAWP